MGTIRAIHNEEEYEAALAEIDRLLAYPEGSPQEAELEVWSILVEAYERASQEQVPDATPIEVLEFVMEQKSLTRVDLEPFIGQRGRVSEVMRGVRPLTLAMIRSLSEGLNIPAGALVGASPKTKSTPKNQATSWRRAKKAAVATARKVGARAVKRR